MKRKKKLFSRPRKAFESSRIAEENVLVKKYGLKNKKEIWKTLAKLDYFRKRAMALARADSGEQEVFLNKLKEIGINVSSISDVLGLKVENLLDRRISSILFDKKLASTTKQARQMIVHKRVQVGDCIVNAPSYFMPVALENTILIRESKPKKEKEIKEEAQ